MINESWEAWGKGQVCCEGAERTNRCFTKPKCSTAIVGKRVEYTVVRPPSVMIFLLSFRPLRRCEGYFPANSRTVATDCFAQSQTATFCGRQPLRNVLRATTNSALATTVSSDPVGRCKEKGDGGPQRRREANLKQIFYVDLRRSSGRSSSRRDSKS